MADMKTSFFAISDPASSTFCSQKAYIYNEFPKKHYNFQSIRKTEYQGLYYCQFCDIKKY